MPLRLPRPPDVSRTRPRIAGFLLIAALVLLPSMPVAAASALENPSASPPSGTTETIFVFLVDYVTDSTWGANSVSVEIVGLGGSALPMSLVAGSAVDGTWQSNETMLPEGSWETVIRAANEGPPPQQPAEIAGPTVVVNAPPTPTPTPGQPTPAPTSQPTAAPSASASASPPSTAAATPVPTPLPPGATPTPTPVATPDSTPGASPGGTASASAVPGGSPSDRPSGSERPSPATSEDAEAPPPTAAPDEGTSGGSGWGRAGWVVLGGATSAAGAVVLARQWHVRRSGAGR